jgi:NAD-dependent SIR2 family protein deacetylase
MSRKVITILSGAGISRESGLQTFRDMDGLWEGYNVEEVCTPQALKNNPEIKEHNNALKEISKIIKKKHVYIFI